jgi:hypothetical protein
VKRACSVLRTRLIGPIGYANDIDFLADLLVNSFANLFAMTKIRREEVYLSPMKAEQFTGLSRKALIAYVKTGVLNQYRTEGGHRRYALSELKALRQALGRHATK